MRYGITQLVMSSPGFVEITEQEYQAIKLARHHLFETLYLEQKFDLVMENYIEYETEMLSSSTRFMVFGFQDHPFLQNVNVLISRRIINLLSGIRLYLDQSTHHLHNIYGDNSTIIRLLDQEKATQYDKHLGYRTMEALRNYVQHRGFPIHSITFTWSVVKGENKVMHVLTPFIELAELEEDSKFKPSVLEELKTMGEKIDIIPLMREYVDCLGRIQNKIRELLRDDSSTWETRINNAINHFKSTFDVQSSITGLAIVIESEEMHYTDSEQIYIEFMEQRHKLESKNRLLGSLATHYVTNETLNDNT